jgi:phosphoglycerate dehydrogenase-like enzyme
MSGSEDFAKLDPPDRLLMGPGPSQIHPRVLEALAAPTVGHLDPYFLQCMDEIQGMLRTVFRTDNQLTFPVSGTGSAGMEACLVNVLETGDRVVIAQNGVFGGRMADIVQRLGCELVLVQAPWGQPLDPVDVKKAIDGKPTRLVGVVHAETSTGVRQPLEDIVAAAPKESTVSVAGGVRAALEQAAESQIILGTMTPELFAVTTRLRWLHAISSGVDMFMFDDFIDSEVVLTGEKGLVGGHLADTGFGLLLSLTRQIHPAIAFGSSAWGHRTALRNKQIELDGRTMGIVGFGGTGRAMARRAVGFGMDVVAVDEFPPDSRPDPIFGVERVWPADDLDRLLGRSDVVAVCCPLSKKTTSLFDRTAFATMKPGSIIVNVTRGEVVDNEALVDVLRSGHLGGAALDVVAGEPLAADHPLYAIENVAMTPHTAGGSNQRARRNVDRFIRNLGAVQHGTEVEGVVDKQLGY